MVELRLGLRTVDLPYSLRLHGVTEEMYDELVDEDTKADLIDGVMIVHSPASPRHDDIGGFLRTLSRLYARHKKRGIVLGPDSVIHLATCRKFAPDLFFLEQKRVPCPLPEKQFELRPDWLSEILSPSNREDDLHDKRPAYRKAGIRELWFVDYERHEVIVDTKSSRGYRTRIVTAGQVRSTVLRGFWIESAWLWMQPLPDEWTCLR